ncbi:hypothetical protein VP01_685g8 [Puccinia sorghi]|uniref:Uncharacterized protein n=1 Tax=Puccinia sorghi TaxID=27349 RepID=A0A0L6UEG3_9BASI|nr:hypothetical protein VP01_685g8 [Puccinia sorghi]
MENLKKSVRDRDNHEGKKFGFEQAWNLLTGVPKFLNLSGKAKNRQSNNLRPTKFHHTPEQ